MARRALCIGMDDYPGPGGPLSGCVNDSNDWAAELDSRGFAVSTLCDGAATRVNICDAMAALLRGCVEGDLLVITYSGHGTRIAGDPREAVPTMPGVDSGRIPIIEGLRECFAAGGAAARIVLIADSCHAGALMRVPGAPIDPGSSPLPGTSERRRTEHDAGAATRHSRMFGGVTRDDGNILLAACKDAQRAWDVRVAARPNGAFTYHALETLRSLRPAASYDEWFVRIRERLPSTRAPQTPQIFGAPHARSSRVLV